GGGHGRGGSVAGGRRERGCRARDGLSRRPDEQPRGGLLPDRLLGAVDPYRELAGGGLSRLELELGSRGQALVVEPVQELAVVLGEPDDRRLGGGLQVGERLQLGRL